MNDTQWDLGWGDAMKSWQVGGVVVGMVLAVVSPVTARASTPDDSKAERPNLSTFADDSGVYHYPFSPSELPGAAIVSQAGAPQADGGCIFEDSGDGAASTRETATITVSREVSVDPATCVRKLAVATYDESTLPAHYAKELAEAPSDSQSATSQGSGVSANTRTYIGKLKVNVEDPAQIDVTSTTAKVAWSGTRSCVRRANMHAYWHWFTGSGWRRTHASWGHGRNCSRTYVNTHGRYKNAPFCWPWTTYTNHSRTLFKGYPRGRWHWSYKVHKSGGCTWLLHYERIVVTP